MPKALLLFLVIPLLVASFKLPDIDNVDIEDSAIEKLRLVYSWKTLDFAFVGDDAREAAIRSGRYRPGAALPIDVEVYYGITGPRVFVTMPRLEQGIPMTLGYVTDELSDVIDGQHLIAPFPDWHWNTLSENDDCDGIISVYRIQIDDCGRLWVLDTGVLGEIRICPPQLLSFSLATNRLLSRYRFPKDQYEDKTLLVTPIVDVRTSKIGNGNQCRDTYVYAADVTGFGLLVYDHANVRSWRIENNLFYPYPQYGTFYIRDETFDLMDGILGMALGPVLQPDGERILYFHSLASRVESRVPTSVIRNYTLFKDNPYAAARSFKAFSMERSSQAAAEAMDRNGVLFFGLMSDLAIGCWNSKHFSEFGGRNLDHLVVDEHTLQFPSGLKVVTARNGRQELWVLTASFQRYMSGSLKNNETNFRIQAGYVDELVRGTKCDVNALEAYHYGGSASSFSHHHHHHHLHNGRLNNFLPVTDAGTYY